MSLQTAITSLKGAFDLLVALGKTHVVTEVNRTAIELQSLVLSAQSDIFSANDKQSAMSERIRELEKEIADLKAWNAEKDRYELKCVIEGNFVYAVKEVMRGSEPMHWLCTNCYASDKKSILQRDTQRGIGLISTCPVCRASVHTLPRP